MFRVADVTGVPFNLNVERETMSDLEAILDGETPEPTVEEPVAEVVEPEAEAVEPAEEIVEDAPEPEKEPERIPLAVHLEERAKRQALEQRVSEMETTMTQKPEAPAPDIFEDPKGYTEHMQKQMEAVRQTTVMDMSQAIAEEKHGVDNVAKAFEALKASNDQGKIAEIQNAKMPYQALMQWDVQRVAMAEIGDDPKAYAERVRAEIRAEVQAEMGISQAKAVAASAAPSMANVTGIGGGPTTSWSGPTSLDKVIGE